jgi:hypothetical protein
MPEAREAVRSSGFLGDLLRKVSVADAVIAALLLTAASLAVWYLSGIHDHISLLRSVKSDDVWFQADSRPVYSSMTERYGINKRMDLHPLFRLILVTWVYACRFVLRLDALHAVRLALATAAGAWAALFYALLRLLGCRRPDSTVFCLVAATSAAALFWSAVAETYLFGSLTIVCVLALAALAERRPIPAWLEVSVAAASLSMLVTNWMFALASLITRYKPSRAVRLAAWSLVVLVALFAVERMLIRSASVAPFVSPTAEKAFLFRVPPSTTLTVFFLDFLVMPDITLIANAPDWPLFSVQHALAWKLTAWGPVALAAWIVLLACGAWAMVSIERLRRYRMLIVLALAGQLALHLVYGEETFLYTFNWLPVLVSAAALATLTRLRPLVLPVALLLVVAAAQHNYAELQFAYDTLASSAAASP